LKTTIYTEQSDFDIPPDRIKSLVQKTLEFLEVETDEVVIHFVDVAAITELHGQFFDDPTPTDCISFPLEGKSRPHGLSSHSVLGEVFVCPKVALNYIKENGGTASEEISLYVVHGLLHLIGYEDHTPEMLDMQEKAINYLKKAHLLSWEKMS